MRRKRFRKPGVSVALFPFLAVLICTMGSLILLLVILVQHARVEADTIKSRRAEEAKQESPEQRALREQQEDAQWRKDVLLAAREENLGKLSTGRLELSHLEEHIRRLQDQWQQLTQQMEDLERLSGGRQHDTSAAQAELARLQAEIDMAKRKLEDARLRAAERPRSFAIVPVPRSNGTLRRPIYLECTSSAVILQPEGIALVAQDFLPPLGPGNALDAALRATREYLAQHGGVGKQGEPYPLLLVRPDGASAYGAARDALDAWDDEFGYELLDAEMQIAYPPPDPALAEEIRRAVELARQRQEHLARSAPNRFRQYRSVARGGGDSGVGGGEGFGTGGAGATGGTGATGGNGFGATNDNGDPAGGGGGPDRRTTGSPSGAGYEPAGASPSGASGSSGRGDGARSGENTGAAPIINGNGQRPTPGDAQGQPSAQGQPGSRPGTNSAGSNSAGSNSAGANGGNGASFENAESIASTRGGNWALKGSNSRANAYTRPVRITLTADRLFVLPEPHTGGQVQAIELRGATVSQIDALVAAVQRQIDAWGTPPVRGYWQPVLLVQVAADGERRFAELRSLLEDSGLDVERRAP